MQQIIRYIINMVPYMLVAVPIIIIFRFIKVRSLRKKGIPTTAFHEIGIAVFGIFIVGLASQTIIPKLQISTNGMEIIKVGSGGINLIPFKVFAETYKIAMVDHYLNYFIINFLGNIIMFMPIGFFIPLLWSKVTFNKTVLIGFSSSLFIETCQLFLERGTDVDDLLLNTLGVACGFLVYKSFDKLKPNITTKFKIKESRFI